MYAVIEFSKKGNRFESNNQLSVVPLTWIYKNNTKCYWPKVTGKSNVKSIDDYVLKNIPYKKSWRTFKIFKIHFQSGMF